MRKLVSFIATLAALVSANPSQARPEFKWETGLPNYTFRMTDAIGAILPQGMAKLTQEERLAGSTTSEKRFAYFADQGFYAFQHMRDTQDGYIWYQVSIEPHDPNGFYDHNLDSLSLVLADGSETRVREIVTCQVKTSLFKKTRPAMIYLFPKVGDKKKVSYSEFTSESRGNKVWYVFLAFDRIYDPSEVVRLHFRGSKRPEDQARSEN